MSTIACPACGREFQRLIQRGRRRKYCSPACRREMGNRDRRLRRGSAPRAGRPAEAPRKIAPRAKASAPRSPEAWARFVRRRGLDPSQDMLVSLAVDALKLSRDEGQDPRVRLQAGGRFQSILRQLNFEEEAAEIEKKPEKKKAKSQKKIADPRSLLRVVK